MKTMQHAPATHTRIASRLAADSEPPTCLGRIPDGPRNAPLAITQLLLLYHLLEAAR